MIRRFLLLSFVIIGVGSLAFAAEDWPTYQGDSQRTGQSEYTAPEEGGVVWKFDAGSSIAGSPIVAQDGRIYVASTAGTLFSLSSGGEKNWEFATEDPIFGTPALSLEGNVHVGDTGGTLYCVSPEGEELWQWRSRTNRPSNESRFTSGILVDPNGDIWIGGWDENMYVVSPQGEAGAEQKNRYTIGQYVKSAATTDGESMVFVPYASSMGRESALAVDAYPLGGGRELWTARAPMDSDRWPVVASTAVDFARQRIYAAGVGYQQGAIACFDMNDGETIWGEIVPHSIYSTPAISPDGSVVVGDLGGRVCSYAAEDGGLNWEFQTDAYVILGSATVDANGTTLIGAGDGALYAIDSEGNGRWRFQTETNIAGSPVPRADGTVLVASYDGYLYAIGTPEGVFDWGMR